MRIYIYIHMYTHVRMYVWMYLGIMNTKYGIRYTYVCKYLSIMHVAGIHMYAYIWVFCILCKYTCAHNTRTHAYICIYHIQELCMFKNYAYCVCIHIRMIRLTGWRRPTGCFIFIGHCPQKNPIINGSFARNDLQLKASYESSPSCTHRLIYVYDPNLIWGGYD